MDLEVRTVQGQAEPTRETGLTLSQGWLAFRLPDMHLKTEKRNMTFILFCFVVLLSTFD